MSLVTIKHYDEAHMMGRMQYDILMMAESYWNVSQTDRLLAVQLWRWSVHTSIHLHVEFGLRLNRATQEPWIDMEFMRWNVQEVNQFVVM